MEPLKMSCSCGSLCESTFFRLNCNKRHALCISCFSRISAERAFDPYLSCPSCLARVKEWDVITIQENTVEVEVEQVGAGASTRTRSTKRQAPTTIMQVTKYERVIESHHLSEPKLTSEPKQFHQNMDTTLQADTTVISLTVVSKNRPDLGLITYAAEINRKDVCADDICSKESLNAMETIFRLLHCILFKNTKKDGSTQQRSAIAGFGQPNSKTIDEIVAEDTSILNRCMYALGYGRRLIDAKNGAVWNNRRAASFAASDIIRNLAQHTMGPLKRIVANQLIANPVSQSLHHVLHKFGFTPSKQWTRLKELIDAEMKILDGIKDFDPHDLWMVLYDNIGFRVGGSQPGWKQFTALQLLRIPKADTLKENLYNLRDPEQALSWDRRNWEDIRSDVPLNDVIGTNAGDVKRLAKVVMGPIKSLVEMELNQQLPTLDDCYNAVQIGNEFEWSQSVRVKEDEGASEISFQRILMQTMLPSIDRCPRI